MQISWCQIQSSFFSTTQEIGLPNWKHHHKCNTIGYHHTSTICWGVLYYVGAASNTDTSSPPSEISFTIGEDSPMQHRHCLSPPKIPAVLSHMKFKHLLHDKLWWIAGFRRTVDDDGGVTPAVFRMRNIVQLYIFIQLLLASWCSSTDTFALVDGVLRGGGKDTVARSSAFRNKDHPEWVQFFIRQWTLFPLALTLVRRLSIKLLFILCNYIQNSKIT